MILYGISLFSSVSNRGKRYEVRGKKIKIFTLFTPPASYL
jgi:hypothetical protein